MPLPPSVLKQVIEKLPAEWKMKKQSVMPYLQKRGVKLEELEYSGLEAGLGDIDPALTHVTKADLLGIEANRADLHTREVAGSEFARTKHPAMYEDVTLPGTDKTTYQENIRGYEPLEEAEGVIQPREVKSHYVEEDYLWHTRTSEDTVGDLDTRVVQEVQSDLHQQGRQVGYKKGKSETPLADALFEEAGNGKVPDAPYKKNWPRKALEQEILDAAATGKQAIAVPIKGYKTGALNRSPGVQKWYEEYLAPTMKKIAKSIGGEYKEVKLTEDVPRFSPLQDEDLSKLHTLRDGMNPDKPMEDAHRRINEAIDFFNSRGWDPYTDEVVAGADRTATPPEMIDVMIEQYKQQLKSVLTDSDKTEFFRLLGEATDDNPHGAAEAVQFLESKGLRPFDNQRVSEMNDLGSMQEFKDALVQFTNLTEETPPLQYAQIILPKDKEKLKQISLYSAGGAEALLIAQSLEQGALPDELKQFLVQEQGMDEATVNKEVDRAIRTRIESSLNQGATIEEILDFTEEQGYDRTYVESLLPSEEEQVDLEESYRSQQVAQLKEMAKDPTRHMPDSIQARVDRVSNIYTKYSALPTQLKVMAGFGTPEDREQAVQDLAELNQFIVSNLEQEGHQAQIHPETGELWVLDEEAGEWKEMEPGLWESIKASRAEIGGGILGGLAAHRATEAMRATPGHPLVKAGAGVVAFGATVLGGATGATFGRYADMTRNAIEAKENIEASIMMDQLKEAAAADAVFSVAGAAVFKTGAAGIKQLYKGWDLLARGNKEGAYRSLKELMHLSDEQVDEIITNWEQLAGQKAPGFTRATKALHVVPRTTPGGEAIVQPAAAMDPIASANAAKEIDLRAQDLLTKADAAASGDISTILRDEMKAYKDQVKQVYSGVKEYGVQEMAETGYKFDYSKLAIDPIVKRASEELTNPALRERALAYLQRIRQLGGVTEDLVTTKTVTETLERPFRRSGAQAIETTKEVPVTLQVPQPTLRSFEDLLELRRVLNEFSSSKLVKNAKDIELLSTIRKKIDGEITRAATKHMDQPEAWLKSWKSARTEYGKMFDLEANVLYKQIMRKGTTDKQVAKQLMNRAMATDNTFRQVIEKLPPKVRALTENSVLQEFVEKYTLGEAGGMRAVNFPQLTEQLNQIPFTTQKAQDLKRVITQMGEVFKNDVDLARATGTIRTPVFQSYLTTDPVVRAKYEIASSVFNYIKRVLPGSKADSVALVMQVGKVLERPLHAKTFEDLLKQLPEDPTLRNSLKAAQLQLAKFGEQSDYPHVPIYRRTEPGKTLQVSEGPLGKGLYYATEKGANIEGTKLSTRNILPQRIAAEDDMKALLGIEEITPRVLRQHPELQELLKDKGFIGLTLGNQVLVFK